MRRNERQTKPVCMRRLLLTRLIYTLDFCLDSINFVCIRIVCSIWFGVGVWIINFPIFRESSEWFRTRDHIVSMLIQHTFTAFAWKFNFTFSIGSQSAKRISSVGKSFLSSKPFVINEKRPVSSSLYCTHIKMSIYACFCIKKIADAFYG